MTLTRLVMAWAAVTIWYLAWEQLERRVGEGARPGVLGLRAPFPAYLADALLITLFGSLWFASLGHGGWPLLFALVGLLLEGPGRYRGDPGGFRLTRGRILAAALGTARIVGAGGALYLVIG